MSNIKAYLEEISCRGTWAKPQLRFVHWGAMITVSPAIDLAHLKRFHLAMTPALDGGTWNNDVVAVCLGDSFTIHSPRSWQQLTKVAEKAGWELVLHER